jgi:hypothetical protein
MNFMRRFQNCRMAWLLAFAIGMLPREAAAYIDPGTTGMLSQVLFVLFYGVLGVFFYFLRYIKSWVARAKTFLAGLFGRNP